MRTELNPSSPVSAARATASGPERCRRKFLRIFPGGFRDATYLEWERDYKVEAHERWCEALPQGRLAALLAAGDYEAAAAEAVRVEARTRHSMLFSFEKMALRDALRTPAGARGFAEGLQQFLHGAAPLPERFGAWVEAIDRLPRRQTRVLTWPMATVWGFLAQPDVHVFVKPNTMKKAARRYGVELGYAPRPNWETYARVLEWARRVRADLRDLRPRDMIDVQSFLWVQGSDEYA